MDVRDERMIVYEGKPADEGKEIFAVEGDRSDDMGKAHR
jgi:hypothetical protein